MIIKDRINVIRDAKSLSVKAFEHEIGISNGLWEKAKSLSEDVLIKVVARYPEINPCWLLKGEGDMFGGDDRNCSIGMVDALKAENDSLNKEVALLKTMHGNDDKTLEIAMKLYQALGEAFTAYYKQMKGE